MPTADLSPYSVAYRFYGAVRKAIRVTGLIGPARRLAGPFVGRLLFRLSPGGSGPVQIRGHKMVLASPGGYPPADMAMAKYEPRTTRLFEEVVKPGMVVMDVGAHVGYYSLLAARQVGDTGRVYAFEPEPTNYGNLVKNISLNGYNNVKALNCGVAGNTGSSTFFLTALDNGRHSMYQHGVPAPGSITVETTTLDAFLEAEDWPQIDLVKIDVEGAEMEVLNGMGELLAQSVGLKLIIEFNPVLIQSANVDPSAFLEKLNSMGFEVLGIDEKRGPLPLEEFGPHFLFEKLLTSEGSINLYCTMACANSGS